MPKRGQPGIPRRHTQKYKTNFFVLLKLPYTPRQCENGERVAVKHQMAVAMASYWVTHSFKDSKVLKEAFIKAADLTFCEFKRGTETVASIKDMQLLWNTVSWRERFLLQLSTWSVRWARSRAGFFCNTVTCKTCKQNFSIRATTLAAWWIQAGFVRIWQLLFLSLHLFSLLPVWGLMGIALHPKQHHSFTWTSVQVKIRFPLQSGIELKSRATSCTKGGFWHQLLEQKYPNLRRCASNLMALFGSTYLYEAAFSYVKINKSRCRSTVTDDPPWGLSETCNQLLLPRLWETLPSARGLTEVRKWIATFQHFAKSFFFGYTSICWFLVCFLNKYVTDRMLATIMNNREK